MNLRDRVLKQIIQFLKSENLSISNVCFFMQQIRLLLEINNKKSTYKITNHYCNWLLHKDLNKSNSKEIINEISSYLLDFKKQEFIKNVNSTLSLKKLVSEIKEILFESIENKKELIYSNTYSLDEFWITFINIILNQILLRPLILEKNTIEINNFNISINGIQIVSHKGKMFLEILSDELKEKNKKILVEIALFKD